MSKAARRTRGARRRLALGRPRRAAVAEAVAEPHAPPALAVSTPGGASVQKGVQKLRGVGPGRQTPVRVQRAARKPTGHRPLPRASTAALTGRTASRRRPAVRRRTVTAARSEAAARRTQRQCNASVAHAPRNTAPLQEPHLRGRRMGPQPGGRPAQERHPPARRHASRLPRRCRVSDRSKAHGETASDLLRTPARRQANEMQHRRSRENAQAGEGGGRREADAAPRLSRESGRAPTCAPRTAPRGSRNRPGRRSDRHRTRQRREPRTGRKRAKGREPAPATDARAEPRGRRTAGPATLAGAVGESLLGRRPRGTRPPGSAGRKRRRFASPSPSPLSTFRPPKVSTQFTNSQDNVRQPGKDASGVRGVF